MALLSGLPKFVLSEKKEGWVRTQSLLLEMLVSVSMLPTTVPYWYVSPTYDPCLNNKYSEYTLFQKYLFSRYELEFNIRVSYKNIVATEAGSLNRGLLN